MAPGKSGWVVFTDSRPETVRHSMIGGDYSLLRPPVFADKPPGKRGPGSAFVGADYYAEIWDDGMVVHKWDGTDMGFATKLTAEVGNMHWVGSTFVMSIVDPPSFGVLRWTEEDGTKLLMGFPGDYTRGATNAVSDGKDLVWLQGEGGLVDSKGGFRDRWVMTSEFSDDPDKIQPRKVVRWWSRPIWTTNLPKVGCGHAVFSYGPASASEIEWGLFIVRLSDGVSWRLPSPSQSPPDQWFDPLAITCDEVFATYMGHPPNAEENSYFTIRRVRLDSLGPGVPPPEEDAGR